MLVGFGHDDMLEEYEATFAVPVSWFIKPDGTVYLKHEGTQTREWFEQQVTRALLIPCHADARHPSIRP